MAKRSTKKTKNKNSMQTVFTRYMLIVAVFIMWIGANRRPARSSAGQSARMAERAGSRPTTRY